MSVAQPSLQDRRPSPNLTLQNLPSNNPFRRAASPSAPSSQPDPTSRPTSTNPFLDNYQPPAIFQPSGRRSASPSKETRMGPFSPPALVEPAPEADGSATEKLAGLTLTEKSPSDINVIPQPPVEPQASAPHVIAPVAVHGHRVARSDEEAKGPHVNTRGAPRRPRPPPGPGGVPPMRPENRRPVARRNSETSVIEVKNDERKVKEGRTTGNEGNPRIRDLKAQEAGRSNKPKRSNRRMDPIDKMDLTGIYGSAMFHHDGPFDACNPHRNRRGLKAAPMQAFAEGSANNSIGGSGPVNKVMDYEKYSGMMAEGFTDYNKTSSFGVNHEFYSGFRRPPVEPFDPKGRNEYIYGEESAGLGASTFLEGTPVSRVALERRTSDTDNVNDPNQPGLQRKKSLAQRIRGRGPPRPRNLQADPNRVASPDGYGDGNFPTSPRSPTFVPIVTQSAGGHGKLYETSPFFSEEGAVLKKEQNGVQVNETEKMPPMTPTAGEEEFQARSRAMSSPRRANARRMTNEKEGEAAAGADGEAKPAGLLGRVKSLKGRKTRPDRSGSGSQAQS